MLTIVDFKTTFFDRNLIGGLDKAAMRALSKLGAFVQRRDKSSVRYKDKASKPGQPPSARRYQNFTREKTNKRTGAVTVQQTSPLRELIFFGYDSSTKTVVIGPAIFLRSKTGGGGKVPRVLEEGGTIQVRRPVPRNSGRKATPQQAATFRRLAKEGRITPKPRQYVTKSISIAARPHTGPALKAELPKLPQFLKDSIR